MKQEDLKNGNIIELRDGRRAIKTNIKGFEYIRLDYISATSTALFSLYEFKDDLKGISRNSDIVKVYEDYTLKKVLWERKEKPKITEGEKWLLGNLPDTHKYIARNKYTGLYVYRDKPKKREINWNRLDDDSIPLCGFNHLFQFIKWEDEEPYLISDLLGEGN